MEIKGAPGSAMRYLLMCSGAPPLFMRLSHRIYNTKLDGLQDRRRKLTDADRSEIETRYKHGEGSLNSLAREYGVSKKTVLLIVNPDSKAKNDQHIRDNWQKYRAGREQQAANIRNVRRHKMELYKRGELVPESREEWNNMD